jgi:hypothetical protein
MSADGSASSMRRAATRAFLRRDICRRDICRQIARFDAFWIERATREPQLRRVTRQSLELRPPILPVASTAAVMDLMRPGRRAAIATRAISSNGASRRPRARERRRTVGFAWQWKHSPLLEPSAGTPLAEQVA